ncbi:hypothetical protein PybrP1_010963 [[Pythium] brassicae (nom. inval.)]|nr:hypothetical protein PybrP1_010963 [[Pythium] brassicae (nom. inval.)]
MDSAAARGHLDIVRFLHENRSEGCSLDGLKLAVESLHLGVVQLLYRYKHRKECAIGLDATESLVGIVIRLQAMRQDEAATTTAASKAETRNRRD